MLVGRLELLGERENVSECEIISSFTHSLYVRGTEEKHGKELNLDQ